MRMGNSRHGVEKCGERGGCVKQSLCDEGDGVW